MSKVLVLGASPDNSRFSYKCVRSLRRHEYEVVAVGKRRGKIKDIRIKKGKPELSGIDTVVLYVGAKGQPEYYEYVLGMKPRRLIFNPGTYNREFIDLAKENGIETVVDCALIMLNSGKF
jgi:predicted CoA-binding protein